MTRQEIEIELASLIHRGREFSTDPMGLARIIMDYLARKGLIEEES